MDDAQPMSEGQAGGAPFEEFRTSMMLVDNAQAVGGKLYVLGGGWNVTMPGIPGGIAGVVYVPWTETNRQHVLLFELFDDSGHPVMGQTPQGPQPIQIRAGFEVGRPAGTRPGSTINTPLAVNYAALPFEPGRVYEWRWSIDGRSREDWRLTFDVRMPQIAPPA
jgi:nitrogen fixation protein